MELLKIAYVDFWPEWGDEDFITPILKEKYELVIDMKNPDVVFHSIFGGMRQTPKYKCKKILFLGENWRPKQFGSDYSISFDPYSETNYRLPLWQVYLLLKPELKEQLFNRTRYENFEKFCAFIVSNPGNNFRNNAFDSLHSYKRVFSYGKVRMNTFLLKQASEGRYWRDAKYDFFLKYPHKFMFAFENTSYPGYCTEKLMDAFLAGSMPIYWGSPTIHKEFNEKAFVNVMKEGDWIEKIKELDRNPEMWDKYYREPVFIKEQKKRHLENMNGFKDWLYSIIK